MHQNVFLDVIGSFAVVCSFVMICNFVIFNNCIFTKRVCPKLDRTGGRPQLACNPFIFEYYYNKTYIRLFTRFVFEIRLSCDCTTFRKKCIFGSAGHSTFASIFFIFPSFLAGKHIIPFLFYGTL